MLTGARVKSDVVRHHARFAASGALVAPAQSMIGTLLTSILQLAGGIVLCFHTSWRLSMLAFVTIAPIMYLTDQYARWSRKLSYEYWSALGDATAKANETLNNIRTVFYNGFDINFPEFEPPVRSLLPTPPHHSAVLPVCITLLGASC